MRSQITMDQIEAKIKKVDYMRIPDTTMTLCIMHLENGFVIRGASACVDPANFDKELGEQLAYTDARNKLWPLEGYLLAQERFEATVQSAEKIDRIAQVCHGVNRAYCQALGDNSQVEWDEAPAWQRESARMGVDLHLMGNFGPEASHEAWMNQKLAEGWVYGPVKDAEKKEHPCMVAFNELPAEQQAKDFIFRAVVHALKGAL